MSTFVIVLVVVLVSTVGVVLVAQADEAQRATGTAPPDGGQRADRVTSPPPASTPGAAVEREPEPLVAAESFAAVDGAPEPAPDGERQVARRTWRPELSIEVPAPVIVAPVAVLAEVDTPVATVLLPVPSAPETAAFRSAAEEVLALVADDDEDEDEEDDEGARERLVDEVRPARVRSTLALVFLLAATGVVLAAAVGAVAALVALGLRRAAGVG